MTFKYYDSVNDNVYDCDELLDFTVNMVEGDVTIRDLNREFDWDLPDDEDYSTIAGLILHEAQIIPEAGQSFTFYNFRFDIVKRQRNQLMLIRVKEPLEKLSQ